MSYVIKDTTVAVVGNTFEQRIEFGLAMAPLLEALATEGRAGMARVEAIRGLVAILDRAGARAVSSAMLHIDEQQRVVKEEGVKETSAGAG